MCTDCLSSLCYPAGVKLETVLCVDCSEVIVKVIDEGSPIHCEQQRVALKIMTKFNDGRSVKLSAGLEEDVSLCSVIPLTVLTAYLLLLPEKSIMQRPSAAAVWMLCHLPSQGSSYLSLSSLLHSLSLS